MSESYPKWATPLKELRAWAKYRGLRQKNGRFRLIILDNSHPLGEVVLRPHLLRYWQVQRMVIGRFKLQRSVSLEEVWIEAPYYRSAGAFLHYAPSTQVDLASCAVGARYYTVEERNELLKLLDEQGDSAEWLTEQAVQQPSSLSTRRSGTSPFASSKVRVRGALPTEQRLFPA